MFFIAATENPLFVKFDVFGREQKTKKSSNATVRFIESTSLELLRTESNIKVNLFFFVDSVGSQIVVQNVLLFGYFHEFNYTLQRVALFEKNEEVNIPVNFFLWQRNIRLNLDAHWRYQIVELLSYLSVFFRGQLLEIIKSVSSH